MQANGYLDYFTEISRCCDSSLIIAMQAILRLNVQQIFNMLYDRLPFIAFVVFL